MEKVRLHFVKTVNFLVNRIYTFSHHRSVITCLTRINLRNIAFTVQQNIRSSIKMLKLAEK